VPKVRKSIEGFQKKTRKIPGREKRKELTKKQQKYVHRLEGVQETTSKEKNEGVRDW
jgi:hypothetical protein